MLEITQTQPNARATKEVQPHRRWNRALRAAAVFTIAAAAGTAGYANVPWEKVSIGTWRLFETDCTKIIDANQTPVILNVEDRQVRLTVLKLFGGGHDVGLEIAPEGKTIGLLGSEFEDVAPRYASPDATEFGLGHGHDLVLKFNGDTITPQCVDMSTR